MEERGFAGNHHKAMVGNWDSPVGMVDWDPCTLSLDFCKVEQFPVADKESEISKQLMQLLLRRVSWIDSFAVNIDTNILSRFISAAFCGGYEFTKLYSESTYCHIGIFATVLILIVLPDKGE